MFGNCDYSARIFLEREVENCSKDVCSCLDQFDMDWIIQIQTNWSWSSLQSTPEWLSCILDDVISGECVQKLNNLIVEHILEDIDCKLNANIIRFLLVSDVQSL